MSHSMQFMWFSAHAHVIKILENLYSVICYGKKLQLQSSGGRWDGTGHQRM